MAAVKCQLLSMATWHPSNNDPVTLTAPSRGNGSHFRHDWEVWFPMRHGRRDKSRLLSKSKSNPAAMGLTSAWCMYGKKAATRVVMWGPMDHGQKDGLLPYAKDLPLPNSPREWRWKSTRLLSECFLQSYTQTRRWPLEPERFELPSHFEISPFERDQKAPLYSTLST